MASFLANEINTTERDITGPTPHVQIMFVSRIKKCRVYEDIFSGTYIRESQTLCEITRCIEK